MKQISILFILPILLAASPALTQRTINSKLVYTVDFKYLEGCETGKGDCKPVTITRRLKQDSLILIFPSGGTQTNVYLDGYVDYEKWINGTPRDEPKPLRQDSKSMGQGVPVLDLTGLPDGKYHAQMISCGLGGGFELNIKTAL